MSEIVMAGKYPQCKVCMTTTEMSYQLTDDGVYLRCPACYKSAIWKEEIRGMVVHEVGDGKPGSPFACNWAQGEIETKHLFPAEFAEIVNTFITGGPTPSLRIWDLAMEFGVAKSTVMRWAQQVTTPLPRMRWVIAEWIRENT